MRNLSDTASMMSSEDYKVRFYAEYWQTKIRYEKLRNFCNKIEAGQMCAPGVDEPEHDCPLSMLREQQAAMGEYLHVLELRAIIEKVGLDIPFTSNDKA